MTTQPENTNGNKEQSQPSYGIDADQSAPSSQPPWAAPNLEAEVGGQETKGQSPYAPDPQISARDSKYLGICSIVLSVISVFNFYIEYFYFYIKGLAIIGIVVGVLGLINARRAARGGKNSSAGQVLSIIGIVLAGMSLGIFFQELLYLYSVSTVRPL